MSRLRNILARFRAQLWILPALITGASAALAYVLLDYGAELLGAGGEFWWLYSGDASAARDLLSSLLSGMMTMTSLVVSVTFVILTLAANQLGPRLISIFMADRQIQSVLGLFLGTILYLVIVLRTLNDSLGANGVPHLAVTAASVLTVGCLFALLFYIHKVARSIIADNVIEEVARGVRRDMRQILADGDGHRRSAESPREPVRGWVALGRSGYVQVVDYDRLVRIATRHDLVLDVTVRAGHFVLERGAHVLIRGDGRWGREAEKDVRNSFTIGSQRTPAQDLEHGIRQLVEIASRALSPGINDTFTAVAVIDRLAAAFEEVFRGRLQPLTIEDEDGRVRVIANRSDSTGLIEAAFNPIRQSGSGHPAILIRLADVLGQLAPVLETDESRDAVLRQLEKVGESARAANLTPTDEAETLQRVREAIAAITSPVATWLATE